MKDLTKGIQIDKQKDRYIDRQTKDLKKMDRQIDGQTI